ncbi:MAG: WYL domain-containing transcriptional regulator [Oscillospiraceae bacterium]|nr:WYL domain-containing transcriptional regulator [Oscillospiraceae bacterium]
MSKSNNQKLKILYIMRMLMENTDEEHAMSTGDIIEELERQGISSERKSIYDDIERLKLFGLDILSSRSAPKGYYIASRDFELPELKLLVDAVQSSKFITEKKSQELIKKIEGLAGRFAASKLQSQFVVSNRIKTMNESIYYNVDKIHSAISSDSKIRCQYCEWNIDKKLEPKKNGAYYVVSPWVLTWDDENYYLIAYDDENGQIRHYRVDKMIKIELIDEKRMGREEFKNFNIAHYSKKTFGMFAGNEKELKICFDNRFIGVVIDRFGKEVIIHKRDSSGFTANVKVNVSAQFYGWLSGLGKGVKILAPREEADKYADYIAEIAAQYAENK